MKQPEASVAIQVLPKVNDDEVIRIVDKVIEHISQSDLSYVVGPFETTIEGPFDQLMDIVREAQRICIQEGAPSVMSYIKIALAPEAGVWSIEKKTAKHQR
ncbi:MAG: thiamine-binding protein [Peptostreptococcaceae bacterium]|nr:thiamine-binding protein [Peptostreptococcaceae bacterium]